MEKGLVLPVEVGDKVLRAFGQVQNGLEVDNLAAGRLYRKVLLGQKLQIAQFFLGKRLFPLHSIASFVFAGSCTLIISHLAGACKMFSNI